MADFSRPPVDMALWRYGIISPLLHRHEDSPPLYRELSTLAERVYYTPDGKEKKFSADTLRLWLWRYKRRNIAGLQNKVRKDSGSSKVPGSLREALFCLRHEHPLYTIKRLLTTLLEKGLWDGRKPSRTAIYRFTTAVRLKRKTSDSASGSVRPFEYPHFGDLWSADFLHGPVVKEGVHGRKSYLHVIIDDATRYVVAATFHLAENTESLISDLMLAVRRFGIPRRFYTDNGAAFRSHHLRLVAAKMRIALPHTPPYKPQGRGKIERFFRSLRDGFLTGRPKSSLQKLNADLAEWVALYQQTIHSSLAMSPLNRKLVDQGSPLEQINPTQNINDLFRMETLKTVHSDGCISMWGKRFEIPDSVPGENIRIYYLPWNQDYLLCGPDKIIAKPIDPLKNARRFDKPVRGIRMDNNNPKEKLS
ncbi:MAG: DDE-type integrase/transposase/recombinase [Fibrobacterota bacterium]